MLKGYQQLLLLWHYLYPLLSPPLYLLFLYHFAIPIANLTILALRKVPHEPHDTQRHPTTPNDTVDICPCLPKNKKGQRYTRSVSFHDSLQDYTIDTKVNNPICRSTLLTIKLVILYGMLRA